MCFEFLYDFVSNVSHSKKNSARYYHKHTQVFMLSTCYSSQTLMQLNSLLLQQSSNIKFHENPSSRC
jgi:hypothetical protein